MNRSHQRTLTALALVALLGAVAVATQGVVVGLACAAPLLALALPLFFDRGERGIAQLAEALARPRDRSGRAPRRVRRPAGVRRGAAEMPRGGRLIAFSLAVRPPPRVLLT